MLHAMVKHGVMELARYKVYMELEYGVTITVISAIRRLVIG